MAEPEQRATTPPAHAVSLEIAPDAPEYYTNVMQVLISQWDFLLAFGATRVSGGQGQPLQSSANADVLIRMSPQHAKASAAILAELVRQYEERWGEIGLGGGTAEFGGLVLEEANQ